jgi:hypothetical protein
MWQSYIEYPKVLYDWVIQNWNLQKVKSMSLEAKLKDVIKELNF